MKDQYGRDINYMRVSITDRCNLRCRYCMPEGIEWLPMEQILTLEEITEACRQAAALGIRKIKVTGGEPLVRKGCMELIGMLNALPGIEQVTLTTNGVLLPEYADELCRQGLHAVNISLDTLDPVKYTAITGFDQLPKVLDGIRAMETHGVPVKINAVLQRGVNDMECIALTELAEAHPVDVRFIELMPIGHGKEMKPVSNPEVVEQLRSHYGADRVTPDFHTHGNGPARYYHIDGFQGSIGFISAIHGKFCQNCNRIRLTATGDLKPCLCYSDRISIKNALRTGSPEDVKDLIRQAIEQKPAAHCFENIQTVTELKEMSKIGG
ncbi:MAG: GTP 3',8-cyclase MoaA [Anaerosacchariphilus sp.]